MQHYHCCCCCCTKHCSLYAASLVVTHLYLFLNSFTAVWSDSSIPHRQLTYVFLFPAAVPMGIGASAPKRVLIPRHVDISLVALRILSVDVQKLGCIN